MITRNHVFNGAYRDSVTLMRLSLELEALDGVEQAAAIMGTETNKELLRHAGLMDESGEAATPNDLIVAVNLRSAEGEAPVLELVQEHLSGAGQGLNTSLERRPRTLEGALRTLPAANLAMISVPGLYAAREARKALSLGLHVLLFSDNVPLEDEVELKRRAAQRGLLMLGPDCGTAFISGVPLGFANNIPPGRVGLVSASGSGLQQVVCLLAEAGEGISHGLGVGGRDLTDQVGGAMMLEGVRALQADQATEIIVAISKPPGQSARQRVIEALERSPKPCVVAFLGETAETTWDRHLYFEKTLEGTAGRVLELMGREVPGAPWISELAWDRLRSLSAGLNSGQRYIRGLFSGGTLCYEALFVLRELGHQVGTNLEPGADGPTGDPGTSLGHMLTDLGDDRFTAGRPHPMIDFRLRCQRLIQEAADPDVSVLLMDVILGYGSHPDPAAELAPALREAQGRAEGTGRRLACVVALCGAPGDPQSPAQQANALNEAGAVVVRSNALAARIASAISRGDLSTLQGS